jgi:ABC-type glycerol-3-phosphate transport system permease component
MSARTRYVMAQIVIVSATFIGAALILVPIYMMISAAIRPIKEILTYPPQLLPTNVTMEFFGRIAENETYQRYFLNSTILALATTLLTIVLGSLAAYGFSRFRIRGGRVMLVGILALLMLPRVTLIAPFFQFAHAMGIYDTLLALILVNATFMLPIATWLLKGYMDSVPVDLEEAAMIDGCTRTQALLRVLLPLSVPGLIGVGAFVFIGAWNEYLLAIVLTDTPSSQPLTVGLGAFFGQYVRDWNSIMALSTMASLPLVFVFIVFQRWVVQGMTRGAVK